MSIIRKGLSRAAGPVASRLRAGGQAQVHLIHAVKNEIVGRIEALTDQNDRLFDGLTDQFSLLDARTRVLSDQMDELGVLPSRSRATEAEVAALRDEVGFLREAMDARLDAIAPSIRLRQLTGERLDAIDEPASAFLNYAASHRGPLADAGLWLNPPVVVEWMEGDARVGAVNERIVEQPFAFAALGRLPMGSRILDVGGGESTVAFSLASLGYRVTVIEPQGYPFSHPNLTVVTEALEDVDREQRFDAALVLSAIEHFGIGHYRNNPEVDDTADIAAMQIIHQLLTSDGMLVLTTPYGPAEVNDLERIYDRTRLLALLDGFTAENVVIAARTSATTWNVEAAELQEPEGPGRVVMVTARPMSTS